jgi:putative restriction endonuclease
MASSLAVDYVQEMAVREAMFEHLAALVAFSSNGELRWDQTESFEFAGETYAMRQVRGRGIHKPRQLAAALSITTTSTGPYKDSIGEDGYPRYKYEGTDPARSTNVALRTAMQHHLPLAYFLGVRRGVYQVVFPVYVRDEDRAGHEFTITFSRADYGIDLATLSAPERVYAARMTKQRLHQPIFRSQVLHAYSNSCAVCRLKHSELLDAAHIVGDAEDGGEPIVPNGLALCKIHHAAYDRYFIGITPTRVVKVNRRLLEEVDGPMLKHGLQEMHDTTISAPRGRHTRPDPDRLSVKFEAFQQAS